MREVIGLMKKLIEEAKHYTPPVEKPEIPKEQIKVEINIREEVREKSKGVDSKLQLLIHEAQKLNNYEELEAKLKEIEKYQEEEVYQAHQPDIGKLKNKLDGIDKSKYREGVIKRIEDKLAEVGKKKDDLTEEERNDLVKIKSDGTSLNKIGEVESRIVSRISKDKFSETLDNLIGEVNELVANVAKGTTDKLQSLRKGLYSFQFSSNIYCREVFQAKEVEVKNALNQLESINYSEIPQGGSSLFRPEIVIPVCLFSMLVIGVVLVFRKVRRR